MVEGWMMKIRILVISLLLIATSFMAMDIGQGARPTTLLLGDTPLTFFTPAL